MNLYRLSNRSVWFVGAALLLPTAQGSGSADRLGAYDFSYEISGDNRVRPVQVFDDGRSTYFQFRSGEPIPAIFAQGAAGASLQMPQLEGPYVKVPAVAGQYALRLGYGTGRVAYVGAAHGPGASGGLSAPVSPPRAVKVAALTPPPMTRLLAASQMVSGMPRDLFPAPAPKISLEENSYATPLKGDAVEWSSSTERTKDHAIMFSRDSTKLSPAAVKLIRSLVSAARPSARYEVIGRDDDNHLERVAEGRARAAVAALVAAGVPKSSLTERTTAEAKEAGKGQWQGVTLRVWDSVAPVPPTRADHDVASVVSRLRAGRITPSEAVALIEQARRAPAQATSAPAAVASAPPPAITSWAVRKADETIEEMLLRWGKDAGWRVVWQGAPSVPITGDATLSRPDFLQAADYVVSQAKTAGYKLRATAYSNQTLVISGE
jgi:hypothetical protein